MPYNFDVVVSVTCDICARETRYFGQTQNETQNIARANGWRLATVRKGCVCPNCKKKMRTFAVERTRRRNRRIFYQEDVTVEKSDANG